MTTAEYLENILSEARNSHNDGYERDKKKKEAMEYFEILYRGINFDEFIEEKVIEALQEEALFSDPRKQVEFAEKVKEKINGNTESEEILTVT
ncbi:MAG: hypothetical protein V5A57_02700 [Candidatus Paceibacterota bacterium]